MVPTAMAPTMMAPVVVRAAAPAAAVPEHWLLVLRRKEVAPVLEYTTPIRRPTHVRYPWER